jgi:Right handed beta helix region
MPKAYLRASGSKHVPIWRISLFAVLLVAFCAFSPAAWGKRPARALLGDPTVESRHVALPSGRVEAFRVHAHASGRAATLLVFLDAKSTATKVVVGLYRNARGRPGELLGNGIVEAPRAGAWNAASLSHVPRLISGRSYWLTVLGQGGAVRYRARPHGRCLGEDSIEAHLSALPGAWSAGRAVRHAHCPISAYAIAGSFSSASPFVAAPGSPGADGAPVNLTPPTITVQSGGALPALPSLAPFPPPLEQVSPVEEKPKEESPTEKSKEEPKEQPKEEGSKEEKPAKEKPSEEPSEEPPAEEKPVKEPAPHNSVVPAIGGTLIAGDVLSTTKGTWSGSPTSYSYKWQDCDATGKNCASISSATAATYTLKTSDVGHTIRAVVTATNAAGSTAATSAATAVVSEPAPPPPAPTNTSPPAIGGVATQGQQLTVSTGSWSGSPTSYSYQWQDCNGSGASCSNIAGASASAYTLAVGDVGHTLRAVVTATNAGGSTPATSAATGVVAAYSSGPPYPACTQTISQGANVASTVSGAAAGSVICLNSGAYGSLTLNASHSSDVTLQAAPEAHVTAGKVELKGSHIVVRGLWIDGEVALEEGASYMTIDRDDITGGGEGIVFDTSDCTVPNAPTWAGCEPHKPISNVVISSNHIHNIGENGTEDAIHLDNWRNVTVTGNEFDHINESGNHTDCLQSVYGGEGLVFDHNYEHDNDCQGIFIKDGDATNVSFTDNLFLRDQEGSYANFAQIWNVKGLTIQHNTIWDGKGFALVAEDASFTPTAAIDHNVLNIFKVSQPIGTPFSITESEDIFGESPTNMSEGAGDSVVSSPKFANTANDDYRLASNPNGIGIDWAPSEEDYGPAS